MTKECTICGEIFSTKQSRTKVCSDDCTKKLRKRTQKAYKLKNAHKLKQQCKEPRKIRLCIVCNKEFVSRNKVVLRDVCSSTCKTKENYRRKQKRPISNEEFYNSLQIKCVVCGKVVQGKLKTTKFCTECRHVYIYRKRRNLPLAN